MIVKVDTTERATMIDEIAGMTMTTETHTELILIIEIYTQTTTTDAMSTIILIGAPMVNITVPLMIRKRICILDLW